MKLIDKDRIVAEIERLNECNRKICAGDFNFLKKSYPEHYYSTEAYKDILSFINSLEVKEVKEKFERPNIKIKDAIEVSSRIEYIDKDLKPIADFIMEYASWNLHKDEWNHPVLEVPLFRVLDALSQRGKPYCSAE